MKETVDRNMDKNDLLFQVLQKVTALDERLKALQQKLDDDLKDLEKQVEINKKNIEELKEKQSRREGLKDGVWWILGLVATILGIAGFVIGRFTG